MTENREITVQISDEILVHAPKMTKAVAKWGVYAIPRLWRDKTGRLIVRFNGEQDTADKTDSQQVPNLFFASYDEGETWVHTRQIRAHLAAYSALTYNRADGHFYLLFEHGEKDPYDDHYYVFPLHPQLLYQ